MNLDYGENDSNRFEVSNFEENESLERNNDNNYTTNNDLDTNEINLDNNEEKVNKSVQSYDENDDFPEYANRINKKLNEIIKNYKKSIKNITEEIDEDKSMVKVLDEHIKSVEQQVKIKESNNERTKEDIKKEEHTIQTVERQIGKLSSTKKTLEDEETNIQDRLNTIQQDIYRANQKMDKYKITMKDKLEELEQWAIAASQKENDNLNIMKYIKQDDMKLKELMLQIEKLTLDVNRKALDLEKEVTETQASQIEMEKTTDELKKLQNERQGLLDKLLKTEEQIKHRHVELKMECDKYFQNKTQLTNLKSECDNKIKTFNNNVKMNKDATDEMNRKESDLFKAREKLSNGEKEFKEIQNDIEIKKGELSAYAKELSNKNNQINILKSDLDNKRRQLDQAKTTYNNKKLEISNNENFYKSAKEVKDMVAKKNANLEKEVKECRVMLQETVNKLYDKSKALFDLREKEANMIGEINNKLSAKKNIKANIKKIEADITKQEELVYNVDFQIQLMERKVAWIQGKRTQEETKEITNETEMLEQSKAEKAKHFQKIQSSLKMINEEVRTIETVLKTAKEEKVRLTEVIEELQLENMKCGQDLNKILKRKEDVLVQHDLMKLEIKKLYDRLLNEANHVFKKENHLYQLELSIKEREKEINVHNQILVAEHKASEEERHKVAMELSLKLTRANNLKLKYESIIQKSKKTKEGEGEAESLGEHSQAYYVIKTAQEKEELQRQLDEMDGKIKKCTKDLESLNQTILNLKERNDKMKNNLISKRTGETDFQKKMDLEEKVEAKSKEMWRFKKDFEKLNRDILEGRQIKKEKETQLSILKNSIGDYSGMLEMTLRDADKQQQKLDRADKKLKGMLSKMNTNLSSIPITNEIELNKERLKNIYLKNAISMLCNEIPEMKYALNNNLQEFGIKIASRPISEKPSTENSVRSIK